MDCFSSHELALTLLAYVGSRHYSVKKGKLDETRGLATEDRREIKNRQGMPGRRHTTLTSCLLSQIFFILGFRNSPGHLGQIWSNKFTGCKRCKKASGALDKMNNNLKAPIMTTACWEELAFVL